MLLSMLFQPNWRILTIGDGDLTFSFSLKKHHQIDTLCASVLDSKETLTNKYKVNGIEGLNDLGGETFFELDITNNKTWPDKLAGAFDLVIFQFPLVPAAKNSEHFANAPSQNIVNRALLRDYLIACFNYFLDKDGLRLSYITSKEVKPYLHWQIETDLTVNTNIMYLGKQEFDNSFFPDYQIRNVDRDKKVKDTAGFIYAYSDKSQPSEISSVFEPFKFTQQNYCPLCRVGPFSASEDQQRHLSSKKHIKLSQYQTEWFDYLSINR